jgi:phosphoserine aminotransferase
MNFLGAGKTGEYVVNGTWGEKAVGEGKATAALLGGEIHVAATTGTGDGKEKAYARASKQSEITFAKPGSAAYLHYTSNETIHGIEYGVHPDVPLLTAPAGVPLICDMSSDFLWRKLDLSPYSFIYAGAQKNIVPSGVLVVLARKDFIAQGRKDIPKIFQYRTAAENDSLYNTPPTFGIYLIRNVLAWVKEKGGLSAIEAQNRAKATALYGAIDRHGGFYRCPVEATSRSLMNVVFRLPSEALEDKFVAEAKKAKMVGLKGHRSVGGIRVSTYNAVPLEWVATLADFMNQFAKDNG